MGKKDLYRSGNHFEGGETSQEVARSKHLGKSQERVVAAIMGAGPKGITIDNLAMVLGVKVGRVRDIVGSIPRGIIESRRYPEDKRRVLLSTEPGTISVTYARLPGEEILVHLPGNTFVVTTMRPRRRPIIIGSTQDEVSAGEEQPTGSLDGENVPG
ncbi:MAG: hypothetical protein JRN11_06515 [Nitrososphaerota archaeon]|nr:hypothetical protein [Nitrososphaerota archaeon]MDG7026383.1 hypothetical protein [Nitrososphaerota archaeon]